MTDIIEKIVLAIHEFISIIVHSFLRNYINGCFISTFKLYFGSVSDPSLYIPPEKSFYSDHFRLFYCYCVITLCILEIITMLELLYN